MFEIHNIIKRQIEILGLALSPQKEIGMDTFDLAEFFGVEELTIKRDLKNLRKIGIPIHSVKKRGICLNSQLECSEISSIILQYAGLCYSENPILDKPTTLLVTKFGPKALSHIAHLQICTDNRLKTIISYNREGNKIYKTKVMPLIVFQNEGNWRVIAQDNDKVKQFLLEKIVDVKITKEKFNSDFDIAKEALFDYSWKTWIGSKKIKIKLHINRLWADRIIPRILIPNQKITPQDDKSIIFEASVNSLDEIAGWIVSRGEGIKVIEPQELKTMVMETAKGVLNNYLS